MKKVFKAFLILLPFMAVAQKEYFPDNTGVKIVNEPYKVFVNATIVVNSETTIQNGVLIERDGKIIDVGNNIKIPKNSVIIDKKDNFIYPSFIETTTQSTINGR